MRAELGSDKMTWHAGHSVSPGKENWFLEGMFTTPNSAGICPKCQGGKT